MELWNELRTEKDMDNVRPQAWDKLDLELSGSRRLCEFIEPASFFSLKFDDGNSTGGRVIADPSDDILDISV